MRHIWGPTVLACARFPLIMHVCVGPPYLPTGFLSAGCSSCLNTLYLSPISGSEHRQTVEVWIPARDEGQMKMNIKYQRNLKQGVVALQADSQRAAWRQHTYQRTWSWKNQKLESAWWAHCKNKTTTVSPHTFKSELILVSLRQFPS